MTAQNCIFAFTRAMFLVLLFGAGPVSAHHRADHAGGPPADLPRPDSRPGIFEPVPLSPVRYEVRHPDAAPDLQKHYVTAEDGVDLFIETWLPVDTDGNLPDEPIPTVLRLSPYLSEGSVSADVRPTLDYLVTRGYAFAQAHVRGTARSGGCFGLRSRQDQDDAMRFIAYLGKEAPWSNGAVGMFGISYEGTTQIQALTSTDRERGQFLKAIVSLAPIPSLYDFMNFDGVPRVGHNQGNYGFYVFGGAAFGGTFSGPFDERLLKLISERPNCDSGHLQNLLDTSGDVTPYMQEREYRAGLANAQAAVLYVMGHVDTRVSAQQSAGFFERLPDAVRKKGLFGVWDHEVPDNYDFNEAGYTSERFDWIRDDWQDMLTAWFDEHLKGLPVGTADWPTAQVQGMDGEWRSEPDWPHTGGPVGQLALGAGGLLGAAPDTMTGSTTYVESGIEIDGVEYAPSTAAVFETAPLPDRLQITGQPMIDLWVSVDRPDAHLSAKLEAFDAQGSPVIREARVEGARSLRHLDPLWENRFVQSENKDPPLNQPMLIRFRFHPTDMYVPKGGRLRLTIAGSTQHWDGLDVFQQGMGKFIAGPSLPSLTASLVSIHHDCDHPSVLRFLMPDEVPDRLNVRERGEEGPLAPPPRERIVSDGGGIAKAPVCGAGPVRNEILGPAQD